VIPLCETTAVASGEHKPPTCEHGEWKLAGADVGRRASKWRCPTSECEPGSRWIKADRLQSADPGERSNTRGIASITGGHPAPRSAASGRAGLR